MSSVETTGVGGGVHFRSVRSGSLGQSSLDNCLLWSESPIGRTKGRGDGLRNVVDYVGTIGVAGGMFMDFNERHFRTAQSSE